MRMTAAISILALGLSAPALAQSSVTATTDLNVRAGPGPQYPVLGVMAAGQSAPLNGCLENSRWCAVATESGEGWVYSAYLTAEFGGSAVILAERPAESGVVVLPPPADMVAPSEVTGSIVGTVTEAPAILVEPPPPVREYIVTHAVEPVYLEGEVVVGAGLPEAIELREIPDYEYRYVYVNGQPVLVDATSRRIVYVVR